MKTKIIIIAFIISFIPVCLISKPSKQVWKIQTTKDKMNDVVTKIYITEINKNFSIILFDEYDDKIIDNIKFFYGKRYLSSDSGQLEIRFNEDSSSNYFASYEKNSVFISSETDIDFILKKMIGSKTMIIRAYDYEGREYDESVNLEKLKETLKLFVRDLE